MDNKYANLPGIARNEPDVYETPTVIITQTTNNSSSSNDNKITSSHGSDVNEDDSGNVTKINITPKECRDKFNTGYLNSDYVDFSDSISNRKKYGYIVDPDKFEWCQDISEGPLQRYKRLERELADLKADLENISLNNISRKENVNNINNKSDLEIKDISFDPIELTKSVESLQKKVNSLFLKSLGVGNSSGEQFDSNAKKQLLIDHLNEFKMSLNKNKSSDKSNINSSSQQQQQNALIFKFFSDITQQSSNDVNNITNSSRISELNRRLASLENVFGAGNLSNSFGESQLNKLCSNLENKSVLGLIEHLNTRLSLFDVQSLDQIESRLSSLSQRVAQLNEKKVNIEDQEKLARVNELYSMITNWRDASASVPHLVERLTALNDIHQKAYQFASILSRLDSEQTSIKQTIETSADALNQLKANLQTNLDSIKTSFDVLNERIVSLKK